MRAATTTRVFSRPAAMREEARQAAETALTLQPNLGEAVLAKGSYYYYCLKDYDTALRYFEQARQFLPNSSRIPELLAYVARRRGQWDRSEAYFKEAERLDPRNVNLLTQHAITDICLRRFRKRCESLMKFSILRRTTRISWCKRWLSSKHKVTCKVPRRCWLRSTSRSMTSRTSRHKFTKESWSAGLHQSSLG